VYSGTPVSRLTESSKRQFCCYVGQRAQVFGLTIAADLRLADPTASDDELLQVLGLVGLTDWLARQPQGLLTVLGQFGVGLSGGELRRFALARALLRKAPLLLLDEPFAGLDASTAESLLQNIVAYQRHGILVIASHQQLASALFNQHWTLTRLP
jgi:ATP-binding cassette subfamily C protein CydC